jgi:butyrate kinase
MNNERPMILDIEDFKQGLISMINEVMQVKNIPCFILEPIVNELAAQVSMGAKAELERARQQEAMKEKANESNKMHNDEQSVVQAD